MLQLVDGIDNIFVKYGSFYPRPFGKTVPAYNNLPYVIRKVKQLKGYDPVNYAPQLISPEHGRV